MRAEVLSWCRREALFSPGAQVVCAVSGGADSMAMLCCLRELAAELSVYVRAAHFNHRLRGAESDGDEAFVSAFCAAEGIELVCGAPEKPARSEEEARKQRYAFLDSIPCDAVAIAHTAEDNLETLLQHLLRGSGLRGLGGIPPRRGCYVRPCLCLTRADTEAYCAALGQHYIRDETNDQDVYARNRIRHDAIPALQYANPAAERSIARLCRQMRALDDWLTGEAAALLQAATVPGGYDVTVLRRAEGPVLDAALHALVSPVRDAEEKYISLLHFLVLKGEGAVQLTPDVNYKIQDGLLVCLTREGSQTLPAPPQPFEPGDFYLPGGYFVKFQVVKYEDFLKNQPIFKKDLNCCADCAKIQGNAILRTRQPGDFFRPAGRHLRKTLKKYYNELGIPQAERPLLPLLADGSEVLWLWGCGFADGCAPDEYTHEVLTVRTEKTGEA